MREIIRASSYLFAAVAEVAEAPSAVYGFAKQLRHIYHFCRMEFIAVNYKLLSQRKREKEGKRKK